MTFLVPERTQSRNHKGGAGGFVWLGMDANMDRLVGQMLPS